MKRLILVVCLLFMIGCYEDDTYVEEPDNCTWYSDLCGDNSYKDYYICCSPYTYDCWYEVDGKEYYTVEYMFDKECGY